MKIFRKALIVLAILSLGCFMGCVDDSSTSENKDSQSTPSINSSLLEGTSGLGGEKDEPFDTPITKFE